MATPKKYKFYILFNDAGTEKFVYANASGAVIMTTDSAEGLANPLKNAPDNWEDVEFEWARSESLHGVFTQMSNEYTFSGDGAKIIRYFFFAYGYSAKIKLRVDMREDTPTGWTYTTFSLNDINLSSLTDNKTHVNISLFESGLGTQLKANLATPYEIPLTGTDVVTTTHNGTLIRCKFNWRYGNIPLTTTSFGITGGGAPNGEYATFLTAVLPSDGLRPIANDATAYAIRMGSQEENEFYMNGSRDQSDQYGHWILQAQQRIESLKLDYKAKFQWTWVDGVPVPPVPPAQSGYFRVDVIIAKDLSTFRVKRNIYIGSWHRPASSTYIDSIDVSNIDLGYIDVDERVYIVCAVMSDSATPANLLNWQITPYDTDASNISIKCTFTSAPTKVQGYQWATLWDKLVNKFSSISHGVSTYLNDLTKFDKGCYPSRVVLTNGNALKGLSDSIFKLTMGDMIDDAQATWPVGVGLQGNNIAIEPLNTFYDKDTIIADLGELTDWSIIPTNKLGTQLIIGAKYDDTDVLNGRYDYNTKSTFKTEVLLDNDKIVSFVSPYISSVYNIEKLRVSEHGKDSTGSKITEDIYKYSVKDIVDKANTLIRYPNSLDYTISVLTSSDTAYNAEFSPKNCYQRLKGLFNSYTFPSAAKFTFQVSDRYKGMQSQFYSPLIASWLPLQVESDDITPDYSEIFWLPYRVRFKSVVPLNLNDLLAVNPYGVFVGKVKGVEIKFFMVTAKMRPSNRNIFEWEGLLSPDTDISKLIF